MNPLALALGKLAAAFPRDNATEATLAVYVEQLSHLDPDILLPAIDDCITHSRRFPTVAEILEVYGEAKRQEQLSANVRSVTALPMGRSPMPDYVRKQLEEMNGKVAERSADLEGDATS